MPGTGFDGIAVISVLCLVAIAVIGFVLAIARSKH
jgi:hypothetical protein